MGSGSLQGGMNPGKSRYSVWLVAFLIALLAIPLLVYSHQIVLAKFMGIGVTVTLVIVLRIWLYRLKTGSVQRYGFTTNDLYELGLLVPAYNRLSPATQKHFQHRIGLIMGSLTVENPDDFAAEMPVTQLAILGACMAFMRLEAPNNVQWIIREETVKIEGQRITGSIAEVEAFNQGIEPEALEQRLAL